MTTATLTTAALADAVANDTALYFPGLTVERQNVPRVPLEDLTTPRAIVAPSGLTLRRTTRYDPEREIEIEIGILQRLDPTPAAGALTDAELIDLAETLAAYWMNDHTSPNGYDDPNADFMPVCMAAKLANDAPFDLTTRRELSAFRCVITLTFRIV